MYLVTGQHNRRKESDKGGKASGFSNRVVLHSCMLFTVMFIFTAMQTRLQLYIRCM